MQKIKNWFIHLLGGYTSHEFDVEKGDKLFSQQENIFLQQNLENALRQIDSDAIKINDLLIRLQHNPLRNHIIEVGFEACKINYTYNWYQHQLTIEQIKKEVTPELLKRFWEYVDIHTRKLPHIQEVEFSFYMGKKKKSGLIQYETKF